MKTFSLSFPRLNISLTASEAIAADIQDAFFHSIRSDRNLPPKHEYGIESTSNGLVLLKDGRSAEHFGSSFELICRLEEDIEITLTQTIGAWVGFHAGAVMSGDTACVMRETRTPARPPPSTWLRWDRSFYSKRAGLTWAGD